MFRNRCPECSEMSGRNGAESVAEIKRNIQATGGLVERFIIQTQLHRKNFVLIYSEKVYIDKLQNVQAKIWGYFGMDLMV